jgi:hypothetical protein
MAYGEPMLDELIEEALERAKDTEASLQAKDWGTAVHRFTEPNSPPHVPEVIAADVDAYARAIDKAKLSITMTECFVVNDRLKAAGTFDHVVQPSSIHESPMVLDKKTGKVHFLSQSIQLATYATGELYDVQTGERTPLDVDTNLGILAHIPLYSGAATLYPVNLVGAYAAAEMAAQVRDARSAARSWFGEPL